MDIIKTLFLTLKLSNLTFVAFLKDIRSWPLVTFFQSSLKNTELKTTHITVRDCRVHFFRQLFSK